MLNRDRRVTRLDYGGSFLKIFVLMALLGAIALYITVKPLYDKYIEHAAPEISNLIPEVKGIGAVPILFPISVIDNGSGLDEVVVRISFRGSFKEIFRRRFNGEREAKIDVPINAEELRLSEGEAKLEVRAFDKSYWNNSSEISIPLLIDLKRPKVQVATVMHNVRIGGSQLLFYKASDDNLVISGVRVGGRIFRGFKAQLIDPIFSDPTIHAVLFTLPGRRDASAGEHKPVVFAEDSVGNSASLTFGYRKLSRPDRGVRITVGDEFKDRLTKLFGSQAPQLKKAYERASVPFPVSDSDNKSAEVKEIANLMFGSGRELDDLKIRAVLADREIFAGLPRSSLLSPGGAVSSSYGETLNYQTKDGLKLGEIFNSGYELRSGGESVIGAVADGDVLFVGEIGTYGVTVIIDHGAGLASVTSGLSSYTVQKGDRVVAGDQIGVAGSSGLARFTGCYFEVRISGYPVDAREWWDSSWYAGHIADQISMAKRLLEVGFSSGE